jgi:hypothetical protein
MALLLLDPTSPHPTPHLTTGRVRPHTSLSVHPADLQPPLPRLAFLPCFANGSLPPLPSSQSKEQRSKWLWGPDSDSRWLRSAAKRWEGKRLLAVSQRHLSSVLRQRSGGKMTRSPSIPERSCCVCLLSDGISSSSAQTQALQRQRQRAPTALLLESQWPHSNSGLVSRDLTPKAALA